MHQKWPSLESNKLKGHQLFPKKSEIMTKLHCSYKDGHWIIDIDRYIMIDVNIYIDIDGF